MSAIYINRAIVTGNLTADPELRTTQSGVAVCRLRIANNTTRKDATTGEWLEKPNFFDITVWGIQAENAARYLSKGRPVAIDGRLEWHEWEAQDGSKRQSVQIVADRVQYLNSLTALDTAEDPAPERHTAEIPTPPADAPAKTPEAPQPQEPEAEQELRPAA